jgi:hypothetical protein
MGCIQANTPPASQSLLGDGRASVLCFKAAIAQSSADGASRESSGLSSRPSTVVSIEVRLIAASNRVARVVSSANLMASLDCAQRLATAMHGASQSGSQGR